MQYKQRIPHIAIIMIISWFLQLPVHGKESTGGNPIMYLYVTGTITDSVTHLPIQGAKVIATLTIDYPSGDDYLKSDTIFTDSIGYYRSDYLYYGGSFVGTVQRSIVVTANGYAAATATTPLMGSSMSLSLTPVPNATIGSFVPAQRPSTASLSEAYTLNGRHIHQIRTRTQYRLTPNKSHTAAGIAVFHHQRGIGRQSIFLSK